jgi:hypothetical protein
VRKSLTCVRGRLIEGDKYQIVVIEADSAAAASKELMRGDVIRAINDVMTRDKTIDQVTLPVV